MRDRFLSGGLLALGLIYAAMALQLQVPFSYDPLGPRPVPLLLAGLLIFSALLLMFYPRKAALPGNGSGHRLIQLISILIFYLLSWLPLGFLLSTTISLYLLSRLFHCSWMQGLLTALVISVTCYGLFNFLLAAPLPLGEIFHAIGG